LMARHDLYEPRFGLTYARELYLTPDGDDLRGEDKLTGRAGVEFAVRFHLHPAVEASLAADNGAAVLRLPSGAVWRVRATGAARRWHRCHHGDCGRVVVADEARAVGAPRRTDPDRRLDPRGRVVGRRSARPPGGSAACRSARRDRPRAARRAAGGPCVPGLAV